MIFMHTWEKVLSGEKTQTRRLAKPNHHARNLWRTGIGDDLRIGMTGDNVAIGVVQSSGRDLWRLYSTYAVQPGRGKTAIARIQITNIRCEDVRHISRENAKAEGFKNRLEFLGTWVSMHDKRAEIYYFKGQDLYEMTQHLLIRPAEYYQAWVLTFRLVTP